MKLKHGLVLVIMQQRKEPVRKQDLLWELLVHGKVLYKELRGVLRLEVLLALELDWQ